MSYPEMYIVITTKDKETNYAGFMDKQQALRYQKKHGGKLIIEPKTEANG